MVVLKLGQRGVSRHLLLIVEVALPSRTERPLARACGLEVGDQKMMAADDIRQGLQILRPRR